jgi:hypothetical protein
MRENRNPYMILVGKPERKGPLGRFRRRCREILKSILEKQDGGYGLNSSGSG